MPPTSGGALNPGGGGRLMYIHSVGAKHYLVIYEADVIEFLPFQLFPCLDYGMEIQCVV